MGVTDGNKKMPTGLFSTWSAGVKTQRDAWAYNYSLPAVQENMKTTIDFFNEEVKRYQGSGKGTKPKDFVTHDEHLISWSEFLYARVARGKTIGYSERTPRTMLYWPFCKINGWFDPQINDRPGLQASMFPEPDSKNIEILAGERGAFITDRVPDLELSHHAQCFPLYWYEEIEPEETEVGYGALFGDDQGMLTFDNSGSGTAGGKRYARHNAITDTALHVFRNAYPHTRITKEDIFYYVYGILHSPEYRKRFENNLRKELPRIPLAKDFKAFMKAGRELADLHLNYESVDRWTLMEQGDKANPGRTVQMTYPVKIKDPETGRKVPDRTILKVAENLTIHGIPLRAYEYVVNGKSAIGWLIDRYKVTVDKKSGIVNDPNEYSDDPRYIVDLVERVITVSMRTLDIVDSLPPLDELPQPADWPSEWR